jgi:hypothetical protein
MPDFYDPADFKKLVGAVDWSEKKLGEFRADRIDVLEQFNGFYYGEGSTGDRVPVNTIQHGATVYHRKIKVRRPQALITTQYKNLKASAAQFRLAVNLRLSQMKIESPLNDAAWEGLFQLGMVKIALDPETGDVYVKNIPFEDVILDMAAKSWDSMCYVGNRYRMPLDWVRKNPRFDKKMRRDAAPIKEDATSGNRGEHLAQRLAIGQGRTEEYREYCELIDIYVCDENQVVTYLADAPDEALEVIDWEGPEFNRLGPYRAIKFIESPGNVMPIGPVQAWRDIHDALNMLTNKTIRQMDRQKTVLACPPGQDDDVNRLIEAGDGDAIGLNEDPKKYEEKSMGGANQINLGSIGYLKNLQNWNQGNTDLLAGSGASTDTVGQDSMLLQGAGAMVDEMQYRMTEFVRDVITDVAWWMWTDETGYVDVSQGIPGSGDFITFRWDQRRRQGEFFDYSFDVEPYSISARTPQQQLQALMAVVKDVIMPASQDMAASGIRVDWEAVLKLIADYGNLKELSDVLIFLGGEMHPQAQGPAPKGGGGRGKSGSQKPLRPRPGRPPKNPDVEFFNKMMQSSNSGGGGSY